MAIWRGTYWGGVKEEPFGYLVWSTSTQGADCLQMDGKAHWAVHPR